MSTFIFISFQNHWRSTCHTPVYTHAHQSKPDIPLPHLVFIRQCWEFLVPIPNETHPRKKQGQRNQLSVRLQVHTSTNLDQRQKCPLKVQVQDESLRHRHRKGDQRVRINIFAFRFLLLALFILRWNISIRFTAYYSNESILIRGLSECQKNSWASFILSKENKNHLKLLYNHMQ